MVKMLIDVSEETHLKLKDRAKENFRSLKSETAMILQKSVLGASLSNLGTSENVNNFPKGLN